MLIFDIILLTLSIIFSTIGIAYIYAHSGEYGMRLNYILIIIIFISVGGIYFIFFTLSHYTLIQKDIALLFWKISIANGIISIGILGFIHNYALELRKKSLFLPTFLYSFLAGVAISIIFLPKTIYIIQIGDEYQFTINSFLFIFISWTLGIILIISIWYCRIKNNSEILDKQLRIFLSAIECLFTITLITIIIYFNNPQPLYRILQLILYLCGAIITIYNIIKKASLFVILTNRIYRIIIFHQSGILLFSYNFEENREEDESILKGSILIGINHILANIVDKKDQINLIKMKDRDIILDFNSEYGFAVLLTTNQKTPSINTAFSKFMEEFTHQNREYFSKLNGKITLIDSSQFKNARELIFEYFEPFIINP
ncbi:MAG: hypothetical protein ACTSR8_13965 [Promethearchaeota archaeon]